ncbi:MAG: hypothetical protein ACOCWQ_06060 [Nanoarchaeota archaeon]
MQIRKPFGKFLGFSGLALAVVAAFSDSLQIVLLIIAAILVVISGIILLFGSG